MSHEQNKDDRHHICDYFRNIFVFSVQGPLTPLRDPDTHKGSVPTDVKEVEKQFNTKKRGRRVCQKDLRDRETRWA